MLIWKKKNVKFTVYIKISTSTLSHISLSKNCFYITYFFRKLTASIVKLYLNNPLYPLTHNSISDVVRPRRPSPFQFIAEYSRTSRLSKSPRKRRTIYRSTSLRRGCFSATFVVLAIYSLRSPSALSSSIKIGCGGKWLETNAPRRRIDGQIRRDVEIRWRIIR